jgi:hypothetical protein
MLSCQFDKPVFVVYWGQHFVPFQKLAKNISEPFEMVGFDMNPTRIAVLTSEVVSTKDQHTPFRRFG